VYRADGSRISFGDAIYHPENADEARAYAATPVTDENCGLPGCGLPFHHHARPLAATTPDAGLREALTGIYDDARGFDGVCRWCGAPPPDDVHDHDVACPAAKAGYALDLPGYHDWLQVAAALSRQAEKETAP
jgi:hypothetical protein